MKIEQVQRGDTIVTQGGKGVDVRDIEEGCSRTKVHINGRFCWDRGSEVQVKHNQIAEEEFVDAI